LISLEPNFLVASQSQYQPPKASSVVLHPRMENDRSVLTCGPVPITGTAAYLGQDIDEPAPVQVIELADLPLQRKV
jgi:hypothetical protein